MIKLELKHLAPYLPYKLKVVEWYLGKQIHDEFIVDCVNWDGKNIGGSDATLDSFELERMFNLRDIKPILRPLSSMTKKEMYKLGELIEGELNMRGCDMYMSNYGMFQSIMLKRNGDIGYTPFIIFDSIGIRGVDYISYDVYEWLFKNHFDIFNLIKNNLAIDKTKL